MNEINDRVKIAVEELDKLLDARNVCGEPITAEGVTVVPLVSYGFGFGGGGGKSGDEKNEQGSGFGAGGGIKVAGVVVIDKDGARVETMRSKQGVASALGEAVSKIVETAAEIKKSKEAKKKPSGKSKEGSGDG